MVCVAPNSIAFSNFESTVSTAIILLAPAILQPWIVFNPTPQHPKTAVVSPILTLALFITDPIPVITAQPMMQALSNGVS